MTECPKCKGEGWVCEEHPDVPFPLDDEHEKVCGGAGMPCICNPMQRDNLEKSGE